MKRYLALFLLLILLIPCMAVPASASAWDSSDVETALSGIEMIENAIYEWYLQYFGYFVEETETVDDGSGGVFYVTPFKYDLIQIQMYVWSWVGSVFDDIQTDVSRLESYVYQIYLYTLRIPDIIVSGFANVADWFSSVVDWLIRLKDSVGSILVSVEDFHYDFVTFIQSFFRGDSSEADNLEEDIDVVETQADELLDVLATSPSIDVEALENFYGSGDIVEGTGDPEYFTSLFSILGSNYLYLLVILSFALAIPGYLLYGKS